MRRGARALFVSENTGAVDLAFDPADPDVVFASVWQARYKPWLSYFERSEGDESGIYRSSDGGRTFARVAGAGWPEGKLGRIGLDRRPSSREPLACTRALIPTPSAGCTARTTAGSLGSASTTTRSLEATTSAM